MTVKKWNSDPKDDRYYVRLYNPQGGQYKKIIRGKRAAELHHAEMKAKLARGSVAPSTARNKTVDELMTAILDAKPNLRVGTRSGYDNTIRLHIKPELGDLRVRELGYLTLTGFFERVEKKAGREAERTAESLARGPRLLDGLDHGRGGVTQVTREFRGSSRPRRSRAAPWRERGPTGGRPAGTLRTAHSLGASIVVRLLTIVNGARAPGSAAARSSAAWAIRSCSPSGLATRARSALAAADRTSGTGSRSEYGDVRRARRFTRSVAMRTTRPCQGVGVEPERFSGPAAVRAAVLPARAAYLVTVGSRAGVRRAVQEASTRWAGATEPIIPVRKGGRIDSLWHQVLRAAKVDGLVNVDAGDSGDTFAAASGYTVVPIDQIDEWGPTAASPHPGHVDGFQQTQAPVIASSADAPLWEVVAAGDVTEEHRASLSREIDVGMYRPGPDGAARAQLRRGDSLVERTVVHFEEHSAFNLPPAGPAVVWVTTPNGVRDCVAFWNLRALRSLRWSYAPMLLLPDRDVEHWIQFPEQFRSLLARPAEFAPDVLVLSATVPEEKRTALAELLGLTRTSDPVRSGRSASPTLRTAPFTSRDNVRPWGFVLNDREYGRDVTTEMYVHNGRASVRIASPVAFTRGGYVLLRITSDAFSGLPRRSAVANAILGNATWAGDALQISTHARDEYPLSLSQPSLAQCVTFVLRQHTTEHALSDKGQIGAALLAEIDVTRLLEPGVTEAITALTTERAPALQRELRRARTAGLPEDEITALAAKWGGRHDRRHRSAAEVGDKHAATALEALCRLQCAERGVLTQCARCGLHHFVPLANTSDRPTCPGCRAEAPYATTDVGVTIRYRLNSFIDRASDQGVIPHLLAIAALTRNHAHTYLLAGTNLAFHDGYRPEIDLFGTVDGRIAAGEVKTKACDFSDEQIERSIDLATRLDADLCVLAAVDEVPDSVHTRAVKVAGRAGVELIVLDRTDLRPAPTSG
ncbi:MAG: hypothetical protein QOE45_1329 [Frankiaceae bacterium]|nr:hypothetical protein [Frankiaceae bacterium]